MDDSVDGNKYICLEAKIKVSSSQFSILRRWVNYNDATVFMIEGPSIISQQRSSNVKNTAQSSPSSSCDIKTSSSASINNYSEIDQDNDKKNSIESSSSSSSSSEDDDDDDDLSPFYGGKVSFM
jgi:hypothetical protein